MSYPHRPDAIPLYALKADLFKALAHPVRVRVLELLATGELQVADLLTAIEIEPSTLSTQLAVLRRHGVVIARRQGVAVYYRLSDPSVGDFLAAARTFLVRSLERTSGTLSELAADGAR